MTAYSIMPNINIFCQDESVNIWVDNVIRDLMKTMNSDKLFYRNRKTISQKNINIYISVDQYKLAVDSSLPGINIGIVLVREKDLHRYFSRIYGLDSIVYIANYEEKLKDTLLNILEPAILPDTIMSLGFVDFRSFTSSAHVLRQESILIPLESKESFEYQVNLKVGKIKSLLREAKSVLLNLKWYNQMDFTEYWHVHMAVNKYAPQGCEIFENSRHDKKSRVRYLKIDILAG